MEKIEAFREIEQLRDEWVEIASKPNRSPWEEGRLTVVAMRIGELLTK